MKARSIIACSKALLERHGGQVPSTMEALVDLPGVGRKTANVVLSEGFGLNEGIISLTEALRLPEGSSVREATAYVRDARKNLSQAGGMKYVEIQPQGMVAVSTER